MMFELSRVQVSPRSAASGPWYRAEREREFKRHRQDGTGQREEDTGYGEEGIAHREEKGQSEEGTGQREKGTGHRQESTGQGEESTEHGEEARGHRTERGGHMAERGGHGAQGGWHRARGGGHSAKEEGTGHRKEGTGQREEGNIQPFWSAAFGAHQARFLVPSRRRDPSVFHRRVPSDSSLLGMAPKRSAEEIRAHQKQKHDQEKRAREAAKAKVGCAMNWCLICVQFSSEGFSYTKHIQTLNAQTQNPNPPSSVRTSARNPQASAHPSPKP